MSNIINITDFGSGRNSIATNSYTENNLQSYLDRHERNYLLKLLGQELYDLFIADLVGGVPQTTRFLNIYNQFYTNINCEEWNSEGMIEMMKGIIYFYYVRDEFTSQSTVNVSRSVGENSSNVSYNAHDLYTRYNNAGLTFQAIQMYLCDNVDTYPEYDGNNFQFSLNL